jgi:MYXO-CTERM domain-containing protein
MLERFRFRLPFFVLTVASSSLAAEHNIPLGTDSANGNDMGVKPGDVVCVEAGEREFLTLDDFVGTAAAPIVIKNCGGQVKIANDDRGYGININGSSFFRLTGTGDPSIEYGFDVSASRTGPDYSGSGVPVGGLSTDYELDHIEVHHTGFAGFILKTESRCDGSANLGAFVQKNTRVHDTYVHDTGGEGFYVGSTGYGGRDFQCDGQTVKLFPHEHDGVYLDHNRIENTGWDGLQVGVTPKNCEVSNNRIVGVGKTAEDPVQTRGIQIGGASACKLFGNYLADGPTIGIFVLGAADTLVYDNVVVDFGEDGIYGNDQELAAISGSSYAFLHNTVVGSKGASLRLFGALISGSAVVNNLFVGNTDPLGVGGNVDATNQGNLELASPNEAGFVNVGADDYRLSADSPARDTGAVVSGFTVEADFDGVKRDSKPDVGAFEYTDEPRPDAGVPSGGGGSSSSNPNGSAEEDDGGCGCRTIASSAPKSPWLAALVLALGGALTARRRRPY